MTDFEKRVWDIIDSDDADCVKLEKIRKLYAPKIDPTTCKNDRIYRIIVDDCFVDPYATIGWRGSGEPPQWCWRKPDDTTSWAKDTDVTVLGEYHPKDEHVGKVYERIEDAVADGMGQYTVLLDRDGETLVFDLLTEDGIAITTNGLSFKNSWAPFTVLHWVPKKVGE